MMGTGICGGAALALAIVVGATILRWSLIDKFYLDFDESMHFQVAKEPTVAAAYRASRIHTHPPLIFLVYHFWAAVGNTETILRLPSLIFGILGLWMGYLWLRILTDEWSALIGLSLLAFSLPMIEISVQMRGYTLWLLLIFAGLYYRERAFLMVSPVLLIYASICMALALLTHYATAWILLVVGLLDIARIIGLRVQQRVVMVWVVNQLMLAAISGWLLVDHASQFRGSLIQREMWANWRASVPFSPSELFLLKAAIWKLFQFSAYIAGLAWPLVLISLFTGTIALWQLARSKFSSSYLVISQSGMIMLPVLLAIGLCVQQVYVLGGTRHSLWLIPWFSLGMSATVQWLNRMLNQMWRFALATLCVVACAFQASINYHQIADTRYTIRNIEAFVDLIRQKIPRHEPILTDDCTRNVMDYYLARETLNHGRTKPHGYKEYIMDDYQIISIPRFHFYYTSLQRHWQQLSDVLGDRAEHPIWIVYLGYDIPMMQLEQLSTRLPTGRLLARYPLNAFGAELLQVQLSLPPSEMAPRLSLTSRQN